jgi:hypothetical protein
VTICDTWSQDLSAGISLGRGAGDLRLNTSGTELWQNSQVQSLSQVVKIKIPPNNRVSCVTLAIVSQLSDTYSSGGTCRASGIRFDKRDHADWRWVSPFHISLGATYSTWPRVPFAVTANRPRNEIEYAVNIVPCDAEFSGNYTPSLSAATQSMKPYYHVIVFIVAFAVHILL